MSITDDPISIQLEDESFTVPEGDTILIKASVAASSLQINGIDVTDEEERVETVVVAGDTIEPRTGDAHIGGFVL